MLSRKLLKIFENFRAAITMLVLFQQYSEKFGLNFFAPNSECFSKYNAFCSHIVDLCLLKA